MTSRRRSRLLSFALWVAVTTLVVAALRALPWESALEQVTHVRPAWVAAAVLCNLAILFVWAAEWRLLIPASVGVLYGAVFEVVSTMATVLNSIPFFAGEATGVALLIQRLGLARGAALSVLALDQLLSGISKLAVLAAVALFVPLPTWLRSGVVALVVAVGMLLVTLLGMAHGWQRVRARVMATPTRIRLLLARAIALGAHLEALRETRRSRQLLMLAASKKMAELAGILAIQAALGLSPSLGTGLLVLASVSVAALAPIAPGNVGVYEAAVFAAYRYANVPAETALALAVTQHVCFLVPMLATGYLTMSARQLAVGRRA
jgi:uncharacterized membrane protein YbhN (UPF0104 family)